MKKTQKETLTPQTSYAYVIPETNISNRKRILITKDIKTFLQSCVRMFNNPKIVRILNDEGDTITDISEIEPMKDYFVTEIGEDFVDVRKATNVYSNQNIDEDQFQELFIIPDKEKLSRSPSPRKTSPSRKEIKAEEEKKKSVQIKEQLSKQREKILAEKSSKKGDDKDTVSIKSKKKDKDTASRSVSGRSISSKASTLALKLSAALSRNVSKENFLRETSSGSEEESDSGSDPFSDLRSISTVNTQIRGQGSFHGYGGYTASQLGVNSVVDSPLHADMDSDNPVSPLIPSGSQSPQGRSVKDTRRSILLQNDSKSVKSGRSSRSLRSKDSKRSTKAAAQTIDCKFLENAILLLNDPLQSESSSNIEYVELEKGQIAKWIDNLSKHLFFNRGEQNSPFVALNEILAKQVVEQHALVSSTHVNYVMKLLITGPHGSGVSSLMSMIGKELAFQLAASDEWKRHFIFGFDIAEFLTNYTHDFASMYKGMIELVLNAISIQKPNVAPYATKIKKQMLSILDFEVPSKGLHPFIEVEQIAKLYSALWRNPEALENWITGIFSLPEVLSRALGFNAMTIFIDNLEQGDIALSNYAPFTESPKTIFMIEHIKYALTRSNFVISSGDYTILQPVDEGGIDITKGLQTVSTADTPVELMEGESQVIQLKIAHEPTPVIITDSVCGGIPKFLDMWENMIGAFIKYERIKSSKKDEFYIIALEEAQKLADEVFRMRDGKKVSVTEISRPPQI